MAISRAAPRIVNERVKNEMRKVLKEVRSGRFARQ